MKVKGLSFLFILCVVSLCIGCRGESKIDYRQKLLGEWKLVNITQVIKAGRNQKLTAKQLQASSLFFYKNGTIAVSLNGNEQAGRWTVSKTGEWVKITADNSIFNETLALSFENERTIDIVNNGAVFKFKKKGDR